LPATVVETPAMKVAAVRTTVKDALWESALCFETWAGNIGGDVAKRRPLPRRQYAVRGVSTVADEIRVLVHTSPAAVSGIPKKVPELMEMSVGGDDAALHMHTRTISWKKKSMLPTFSKKGC